jgi:hypothetical protein
MSTLGKKKIKISELILCFQQLASDDIRKLLNRFQLRLSSPESVTCEPRAEAIGMTKEPLFGAAEAVPLQRLSSRCFPAGCKDAQTRPRTENKKVAGGEEPATTFFSLQIQNNKTRAAKWTFGEELDLPWNQRFTGKMANWEY